VSKLFKISVLFVAAYFCLGFSFAANPLAVKVSKTKVKTGEVFIYTVVIKGSFSSPTVILPKFKDFKVLSRSESKSYSLVKGKTKVYFKIVYYLFASKPGAFIIPRVVIKDKIRRYKSKLIVIKVKGKPLKNRKKILPYIKTGTNI